MEPDYYKANGLSPLTAFKQGLLSEEEYLGFLKGNVIKYLVRAGKKDNAVEDMNKCIDYCHHLQSYYVKHQEDHKSPADSMRQLIIKGEKQ